MTKPNNFIIFSFILLAVLIFLVSCGGEGSTTTTPNESTAAPVTTVPDTTPITTAPTTETQPENRWQEKFEDGFYDKAVVEDGKYCAYLSMSTAPFQSMNTSGFIQTYVANPSDVLYGNDNPYSDIVLRATAEELEVYARTPYVISISAYPIDKAIDSFAQTRIRIAGSTDPDAIWNAAENRSDKDNGAVVPIIKLESVDALNTFITQYNETFFLSQPSFDLSFVQHATKYDTTFFDEKLLLLTYFEVGSGSISHTVVDLLTDDGLTVFIDVASPSSQTVEEASWFIFVEVDKASLENVTEWRVTVK